MTELATVSFESTAAKLEMAESKSQQLYSESPTASRDASGSSVPYRSVPAPCQVPPTFDMSLYDPESRTILSGTNVHMSHSILNDLITQEVNNLYQTSATAMRDNISYDNLLQSLLFKGERLLINNQFVYYGYVSFLDECGAATLKPAMRQGRAFLTSHRLLLLSAEISTGAKLSKFGDPKKLPGGYHVETSCCDTLHCITIPMGAFKSVELYASMGVKAETNIHGQKPCCFGWFGLCGMEMCLKRWMAGAPQRQAYNDRYIMMGVNMPPWGHRTMVQMYLNPSVSLSVAKDFICALQANAPSLREQYILPTTGPTL